MTKINFMNSYKMYINKITHILLRKLLKKNSMSYKKIEQHLMSSTKNKKKILNI